jgi:hypothetical protein
MDPVTGAALISGATSLLGGLMQQEANRKDKHSLAKMEAIKMGGQSQIDAQTNMQRGVNDALSRLMQQYSSMAG